MTFERRLHSMLKLKLVSSQVKAFLDDSIGSFKSLEKISALGGEKLSFCVLYVDEGEPYLPFRALAELKIDGELSAFATVRDVRNVPVDRPVNPLRHDDQYLRKTPGLYPDLLTPLRYNGKVVLGTDKLRTLWVEINIPKGYYGDSVFTVTITEPNTKTASSVSVDIHVIAADLPKQELLFTQWFYPD